MGWNRVHQSRDHPLWEGCRRRLVLLRAQLYARPSDRRHRRRTDYGARFTSAVARDNIFATSFHPEKAPPGLALYRNFLPGSPALISRLTAATPILFIPRSPPGRAADSRDRPQRDGHVRLKQGRHGPGHRVLGDDPAGDGSALGRAGRGAAAASGRPERRLRRQAQVNEPASAPSSPSGRRDPGAARRRHPRPRHHRALPRRRPALRDHRHRGGQEPRFLQDACTAFGGHIIVGLDAKDSKVATDGWSKLTGHESSTWRGSSGLRRRGVIYTDIGRDGMLRASTSTPRSNWRRRSRSPSSRPGGLSSLADIEQLCAVEHGHRRRDLRPLDLQPGELDFAAAQARADDPAA